MVRPHQARSSIASPTVVWMWGVLTAGVCGFAAISFAVFNDFTSTLDRSAIVWFRDPADLSDAWGPPWFEETAAEITALGGYPILVLAAFLVISALVILRKHSAALFLFAGLVTGSAASTALKHLFDRPRPDLVDHLDRTFTSSFPSGHAMVSMIAWLTIAAVALRFIEHGRLRTFVLSSAVGLSLLIGATRVYLGVHWPSDVLAGWCVGAAWASACWLSAHYLTRNREQSADLGHSS